MITVLEYLVIAAAVGLAVFFIAVFVFGRGEQMAALPARTSPAELPDAAIVGNDVRTVRFAVGVRGYRMGDVDWTLDRVAEELDRLRGEVSRLGGDPDAVASRDEVLPEHHQPAEQPERDPGVSLGQEPAVTDSR
ncbi:MAG: DivIVA domain-containing protein [Actinomycetota bacterium]|nr:DivIVA domain-containing protein [Actinomycetota bacterium]